MSNSSLTTSIPGPVALAKEAWQLLITRVWSFIRLFGINIGLVILGIIAALIVGGAVFFLSGQEVTLFVGIVLGFLALVLIVLFTYISLLFQAAYLLVLDDNVEKKGIKTLLNRAKVFIWPLFLTSLISGLIVMGGFFLLLIPGIILSILFSQTQFVVVFENKKGLLALHTSREYIRGRFFPFLWRYLAVYLPLIILGFFTPTAQDQNGSIFNAITQIISLIAGPFYLAYGYVLYKHLANTAVAPIDVSSKDKKIYLFVPLAGVILLIFGIIILNVGL